MNAVSRDFTVAGAARHIADQFAAGKMTATLAMETLQGVIRRADAEAAAFELQRRIVRYRVPLVAGRDYVNTVAEARERASQWDGLGHFFAEDDKGNIGDAIPAAAEVAA